MLFLLSLSFLFFIPALSGSAAEAPVEIVSTIKNVGTITELQEDLPRTVLLAGDILLARDVEQKMEEFGFSYPYQYLVEFIDGHDYVVGNFEATVPQVHQPTPPLSLQMSVASTALPALKRAGFTHVSLANNHSFDFGEIEYEHTQKALLENALIPFGKPQSTGSTSVAMLMTEWGRVAIIGLDATIGIVEESEVASLFAKLNNSSDFQLVFIHWGEEYQTTHSKTQETLATLLVSLGADLVVGHHPHVVQDVGLIDGVPIFYSLGNFIFDQYFSDDVQTGLLLSIDFSAEPSVTFVPVSSLNSRAAPYEMALPEYQAFLQSLAERSSTELEEYIAVGTIPLSLLATSPQVE